MGHTKVRCKKPIVEEDAGDNGAYGGGNGGYGAEAGDTGTYGGGDMAADGFSAAAPAISAGGGDSWGGPVTSSGW